MLKEYHLPSFIGDLIVQHHGTGLVGYFYRQMIRLKDENFDEDRFRYEGPIPQTKEAAILMLADVVEAAVRTLENPSLDKLNHLISRLFKEKIDDGQMDAAPLTLSDFTLIKKTFIVTLSNVLHARIEYSDEISSRRG